MPRFEPGLRHALSDSGAAVEGILVGPIDETATGYAPIDFLAPMPPSGHMIDEFVGETDGEVSRAEARAPVWRLALESQNGWVSVWLASGERGAVPEDFVEWVDTSSGSSPQPEETGSHANLGRLPDAVI